jgi:hypothetical protein
LKQLIIGIALMGMFGCSHSGVVPIGQDTFMIANEGWSSGSTLKAGLYQEANEFCIARGQQLMPIDAKSNNSVWGSLGSGGTNAAAEISFRCLSQTDAELHRPKVRPDSTIGIEQR